MEKVLHEIIDRLKKANFDQNVLCKEYWSKLLHLQQNFNENQAWELLLDNIEWIINTGTITTAELKQWFTADELKTNHIYQDTAVINNGIAIGIGNAKIEATGHSRVILFDYASCEAYDTTFVKGFNHSQMTLHNCIGDAFSNCKVTAKDHAKVEAWDSADVTLETYSYLYAHDKVTHTKSKNCYVAFV